MITPTDLDALRTEGFDDWALHDAVQVTACFNHITRVADALGVEPEEFIPPEPRRRPAAAARQPSRAVGRAPAALREGKRLLGDGMGRG